ncbi:hypothetical protein PINS_up004278 [Pythium insidiosum]|nr:hypothetical protein PINS_up004278 [Pythium insidiosum]
MAVSGSPTEQTLYHVRLIDPWTSSGTDSRQFSFFGLDLELRGVRSNGASAALTLSFSSDDETSDTAAELESVRSPFELVVKAKIPPEKVTPSQRVVVQSMLKVQVDNRLARINKIHFLKAAVTARDVQRALLRVLERVSVARPMELTFLRHNHAQASAKIIPFAGRADVQRAQVEQFLKMQQDEAQWTPERLRRKQFNLQQMDLQREAYLYHHIGMQLQTLHDDIMAGGQWQAYEFEKALWYYHAPTNALYAEHPMRNSEKTRQLIGSVQLRTRVAAQRLQLGTRRFLRVTAMTRRVLEVMERKLDAELWRVALDDVWRRSLQPFYVANFLRLQRRRQGVTAEADELWELWLARDPEAMAAEKKSPESVETENVELVSQTKQSFEHWGQSPTGSDHLETSTELCVAIEAPSEAVDATRVDVHDDDDDDDDDANWRSRLRLLKLRHKRLSPGKAQRSGSGRRRKTTSVVPPEPTSGLLAPGLATSSRTESWDSSLVRVIRSLPVLMGPSSQIICPRVQPPSVSYDKRVPVELPEWRCDGSFRSFHAFFNGTGERNTEKSVIAGGSTSPQREMSEDLVYQSQRTRPTPQRSPESRTYLPQSSYKPARTDQRDLEYDHPSVKRRDRERDSNVRASARQAKKLPYIRLRSDV